MKKAFLTFSAAVMLLMAGMQLANAQNQQPAPQKDSVNADTYAKPENYYSVEDEKKGKSGTGTTVAIVAGAVVVVGAAGYFLLRKKKKE